jgi:hypothetical protein
MTVYDNTADGVDAGLAARTLQYYCWARAEQLRAKQAKDGQNSGTEAVTERPSKVKLGP